MKKNAGDEKEIKVEKKMKNFNTYECVKKGNF